MKKNNSQSVEVLEVEEIPLEQVIVTTLAKNNVTESVLKSLKENYGNVRLKNINDKESFLEVREARKNVRAVGILVEKLCKKGREDAVAIQRKWLKKESEILGIIAEIQDPLDSDIKKFEDEVERKELTEKKRQEEIYINRQTALSRMGASYDNGSYVLNHISYEVELIKQADDDMWNDTIYPKYKKVYEENQAALVEEENKRKAEMELAKKQREEFELQQKKFKEDQEVFAKQQAELQKQQMEIEKKEQEKIATEIKAKNEADTKIWRERLSQLVDAKWNGHEAFYDYEPETKNVPHIIATYEALLSWTDKQFEEIRDKHNVIVEKLKKEAAEKLAIEQEQNKQAEIELALQKERERVAEANRQAELRKQQEEAQKAEELAKSGDKVRWQHFLAQLNAIQVPQMNSGIYRGKVAILKEKLEEVNSL